MRRTQRGFTLVEVMLSVAISATCLMGLTNLQVSAKRANGRSRELSLATALAQSKLEQVAQMDLLLLKRVRSYPEWASWRTEVTGGPDETGQLVAGKAPTPITVTVDVSVPVIYLGGVTAITVTVCACWSEAGEQLDQCAPTNDRRVHRLEFRSQRVS